MRLRARRHEHRLRRERRRSRLTARRVPGIRDANAARFSPRVTRLLSSAIAASSDTTRACASSARRFSRSSRSYFAARRAPPPRGRDARAGRGPERRFLPRPRRGASGAPDVVGERALAACEAQRVAAHLLPTRHLEHADLARAPRCACRRAWTGPSPGSRRCEWARPPAAACGASADARGVPSSARRISRSSKAAGSRRARPVRSCASPPPRWRSRSRCARRRASTLNVATASRSSAADSTCWPVVLLHGRAAASSRRTARRLPRAPRHDVPDAADRRPPTSRHQRAADRAVVAELAAALGIEPGLLDSTAGQPACSPTRSDDGLRRCACSRRRSTAAMLATSAPMMADRDRPSRCSACARGSSAEMPTAGPPWLALPR